MIEKGYLSITQPNHTANSMELLQSLGGFLAELRVVNNNCPHQVSPCSAEECCNVSFFYVWRCVVACSGWKQPFWHCHCKDSNPLSLHERKPSKMGMFLYRINLTNRINAKLQARWACVISVLIPARLKILWTVKQSTQWQQWPMRVQPEG